MLFYDLLGSGAPQQANSVQQWGSFGGDNLNGQTVSYTPPPAAPQQSAAVGTPSWGAGAPGMPAGSNTGNGMAYAGGLGGTMMGTPQPMDAYQSSNPWQNAMAGDLTRRTNDMLGQQLEQLRSRFAGVGGLGGSRQGVAEGLALQGGGDALSGNLANLFGGLYTGDQNRNLQRYGMDQSFFQGQRGQDLQQLGLGAQILGQGVQMPWLNAQNGADIYGRFANVRGSQQDPGSDWTDYLGAGLGIAQLGKSFGWWGN